MTNHVHALLWVDDALQLATFMGYFASNLAREIARLTGWTDKIWARRYQAIVISDEEAAQTARFEYLLANGVKEGLVEHVRDWPGVHCVRNLLDGEPLEGLWFDRTKEYSARNRGKTISPGQFATTETVTLSPLPCWEHLSPEQIRARIDAIVQRIEETAAQGSRGERIRGPRCRRRACAETVRPAGQAEEVSRASLPCVHPPRPS